MTALKFDYAQNLETTTCASCGVHFGVPEHFMKARRQDKAPFYCPNGHQLSFRESELDRVRAELEATQRGKRFAEERATRERRRAAAARGQVTRIRNRVGNGVCPCCNRSFTNLRRHMATKHPDFRHDEPAKDPQP